MIRISLFAAIVTVAATTAASAMTPYLGTSSDRFQDTADQMSISAVQAGSLGNTQVFGAPQDTRSLLGTPARSFDAASSIGRNAGTSSDRFQDTADQMSISTVQGGSFGDAQIFGAPQDMRSALGTATRSLDATSSIRRNAGTSSDRFQDNADAGR